MKKINIELKKIKKMDLILPVSIMGALLVAIFVIVQMLNSAERVTVEEPLYQFMFENADDYPEGITMKKTEEQVLIDNGVQTYESDGTPFYYKNEDAMILTEDFLYLGRNGDLGGKVSYFTKLSSENGSYLIKDQNEKVLNGGMLHDGGDVYIFLEGTEITYNGKTEKIKAFSYVTCFRGESILICNYGEDAIYEVLDENGASAVMENGIEVNLVNDIYYRANGTKHLLFSNPGMFDSIN